MEKNFLNFISAGLNLKLLGRPAAFTLIDFLVIVIILGIFAAVVYPKYEIITEKNQASEALVTLRSIINSSQRFLEKTGAHAQKFSDLDFPVEGELINQYTIRGQEFTYKINRDLTVEAYDKDNKYIIWTLIENKDNSFYCDTDKPKYKKVCLALDGVERTSGKGLAKYSFVLK